MLSPYGVGHSVGLLQLFRHLCLELNARFVDVRELQEGVAELEV